MSNSAHGTKVTDGKRDQNDEGHAPPYMTDDYIGLYEDTSMLVVSRMCVRVHRWSKHISKDEWFGVLAHILSTGVTKRHRFGSFLLQAIVTCYLSIIERSKRCKTGFVRICRV